MHLSPSSAVTTRKTLLHFINDELGQNDEAAVASSSGQIGFLQQVTGERAVLLAAVDRINSRASNVRDLEHPPMNEHQALAVDRNQREITDYFIEQILRENPFISRSTAETMVTSRARHIIEQTQAVTRNTLTSLENLVRTSAEIPGRKLVLFISDGFFIEDTNSTITEQLRRITDAAARSGVVIYTMDARGLTTAPAQDPTQQQAFDPSGRLQRLSMGELSATQNIFTNLASDTGGRALLNSNTPERILTQALQDSSIYYLLAWQPEHSDQHSAKFRRIEVRLPNHPELNVIVRRGFYDATPDQPKPNSSRQSRPAPSPSPDAELMSVLRAAARRTALPTFLSLSYADAPAGGLSLNAGLQIEASALDFQSAEGGMKAAADVVCAVYDDQGKFIDGFKHQIAITAHSTTPPTERSPVVYVHQFKISPGLYQVRSATRDVRSGRVGSAVRWIEIPDLTQGKLSLSSIFITERLASQPAGPVSSNLQDIISTNADHLFQRSSNLRFLVFVYNAKRADAAGPDVAIQVQVFRDDQPVITDTLHKIPTDATTDLARIPYAADFPLESLPAGRYVLQLTVIDRMARASASQRVSFDIE